MTASSVDRIHAAVKQMAADFRFMPDERINEGHLAKSLDASRTPLREALNRLVAEGYLTFRLGQGFFCRSLTPEEIIDLYEARVAVETTTARLAATRAKREDIRDLHDFLIHTGPDDGGRSAAELVALDEEFHMRIAAMAGNSELSRILDNLNGRIRFVRWIDMDARRPTTQAEHATILQSIRDRDGDRAAEVMASHISRRREEIVEAVREGFARLYVARAAAEANP